MTLTSTITELFAEMGTITSSPDIEFTRDSRLTLTPNRAFTARSGEIPELKAWIYRRYNGTKVLRIDAETEEGESLDMMELNRWVVANSGRMPFAAIRIRESRYHNARLIATHSMIATDVNSDALCEIISSVVYMWRKCVEQLSSMEPLVEEGDDVDIEEESFEEPSIVNAETPPEITSDRDIFGGRGKPGLLEANGDAASVIAELEALIGLAPVKAMVYQLAAQQKIAALRQEQGLRAVVPSPHLVFMGNPGTGKTTVARLIGKLYKALGLLSSGHVIEAERNSLVSGYLGQTALKTREVCERALNGVLFIDEAYSLVVDGRDYGQEAIETMLTFMENHRNEFVLVVAGYPEKMQEFLTSNPGLKSRFDLTLDFPDYDIDELMSMFASLVHENEYSLTPEASAAAMWHIDSWSRGEGFGNGRDIRRLFNVVVGNHAANLADVSAPTLARLQLITEDAIPAPLPIQINEIFVD
jgi:hypothetical protein